MFQTFSKVGYTSTFARGFNFTAVRLGRSSVASFWMKDHPVSYLSSSQISRKFSFGNLEAEKDRLRREEVMKVRNQAKKLIMEEKN